MTLKGTKACVCVDSLSKSSKIQIGLVVLSDQCSRRHVQSDIFVNRGNKKLEFSGGVSLVLGYFLTQFSHVQGARDPEIGPHCTRNPYAALISAFYQSCACDI